MTKALHKETLRIYVEDCLEDELPEGLKLLGSQGAIWREQGGSRTFAPGINGMEVGNQNISYSISLPFTEEENKYPCSSGDPTVGPAFCQFTLPNRDKKFDRNVFFGHKEFSIPRLERDLSRFLQKQLEECVKLKIFPEGSAGIESSAEGAELNVKIQSSAITVNVHYPLKFSAGNQEIFTLSEFDFVYPTTLGEFFNTVAKQIDNDILYGDFPYKRAFDTGSFTYLTKTRQDGCQDAEGGLFTCPKEFDQRPFQQFDTQLQVIDVGSGMDLVTYTLTTGDNNLDPYSFKIARQNRPPALSYISQCPAEDYDYLYVPNTDLNADKFKVNSLDADEDEPQYEIKKGDNQILNPQQLEQALQEGTGIITVKASDGNKEDWQDVRVRVDDKIEPRVTIRNMVTRDIGPISLEDPVCILAERPENVPADAQVSSFQFSLNGQPLNLEFGQEYGLAVGEGDSVHLVPGCNLADFDIITINTSLREYISPLQQGALQQHLALQGRVSYSGDVRCQYDSNNPVAFQTEQCHSVADAGAPSVPYVEGMNVHQYELNEEGNYEQNLNVNSFTVPRPCCNGNSVQQEGEVCFDSTQYGNGCFENEYLLQHVVARCDGIRGNICGGGGKEITTSSDAQGNQLCGRAGLLQCNADIPEECGERPAWGMGNNGWCSGHAGCTEFCTEEVVDKSAVAINPERITANSIDQPLVTTSQLSPDGAQFQCGCTREYNGFACDGNFDGRFNGVCEADRFLGIPLGTYSCHEEE